MAEAIDTQAHKEMADEMNQTDLTSETETAQPQMVELQPLLSSQPSDPSQNHFQQQQHVLASLFTSATMAEVTDTVVSAQPLKSATKFTSTTIPREPFVRSHEERTQDPRSPHSSQQQVEDEVILDIKEMIQDCGDGLLSPECCIYKVPTTLRHLKEEAYTPQVVSIGPFHHGSKRLQNMERHKRILFKRFTHRVERAGSSLDDLVGLVKHLEPKARAFYSETINLTQRQLVRLILMDASFIIELFISSKTSERHNDAKLSQEWLYDSVLEDLLLMENQLPFFVIEDLFNKAFPHIHEGWSGPSFLQLTYDYFGYFNKQELEPNPHRKIKHFTDLLRLFYLHEKMPIQDDYSTGEGSHILLYNANGLKEAGIKLKASKSKCLLNLKFLGHILEIPQILVEDSTEVLFRNMIALEQCLYPHHAYITDYALVLDCLIDTYKDVNLLVDKKIVCHYLGDSRNVASLFNGVWKNVVQLKFNSEYIDICERLNSYCQDPKHKLKATLRRDYCNTAWRTVASIAGIILLVLTIVQTIFSVLQVVLKK